MNSIQIIADQLALVKLELEQSHLRLAEKEQENASLREQIAWLRQNASSTPENSSFYTPPAVLDSARKHSR